MSDQENASQKSQHRTHEALIKELQEKQAKARLGGGQARIDAQHAKGKLSARERIHLLVDEDSFQEIDSY